jgi:hypothetical protein
LMQTTMCMGESLSVPPPAPRITHAKRQAVDFQ